VRVAADQCCTVEFITTQRALFECVEATGSAWCKVGWSLPSVVSQW